MVLFRTLGWFMVFVGLACLAYDVNSWLTGIETPQTDAGVPRFTLPLVDGFIFHSVAEIWVDIHANSLIGFGAWLQQSIFASNPDAYGRWVAPVLTWPATLFALGLGLLLLVLFRRRRTRRWR